MKWESDAIRLETSGTRGRYSLPLDDGSTALLDFFEAPAGTVTIMHTETPPQHRGQGLAAILVERAVADFRAAGKRIIPACPFAARLFDRHPEWSDLRAKRG
jgi:predicted GNAT family acetyltransferase